MESTISYLENPTVQKALIIIIIIVVGYVFLSKKREGYSEETKFVRPENALEKDMRGEEIIIQPPMARPDTRTLMSGSGYVPQKQIYSAWGSQLGVEESLDDNDLTMPDGSNMGLHYNLCSKSCCSAQWSLPFKMNYDKFVCQNKDEFMPNNYVCQNSYQDAGCLCLTKQQYAFMGERGGNA